MIIYLAADHAGFALKEKIKIALRTDGYQVEDEGAFQLTPGDDYPDFISIVGKQVAANPTESRGIILGASGEGEAMVANRFPGVRAAVYYGGEEQIIILSREHNDANVLALGAKFLDEATALRAVKRWLATDFSGDERHVRRIKKIDRPTEEIFQF